MFKSKLDFVNKYLSAGKVKTPFIQMSGWFQFILPNYWAYCTCNMSEIKDDFVGFWVNLISLIMNLVLILIRLLISLFRYFIIKDDMKDTCKTYLEKHKGDIHD